MEWIVYCGALLSLAGLAGIVWSVLQVRQARKLNDDEHLKDRLQRILPINIAAFMLSVLGLGAITVGLILAP